jgi:hypothetical protein
MVIDKANMQRHLQEAYNKQVRNVNQHMITFKDGTLVFLYEAERILAQQMRLGLQCIAQATYQWTGPWHII